MACWGLTRGASPSTLRAVHQTTSVTLSDRLQTKLDSARAQRVAATAKPNPRAFTRLHAIGLGIGLLMGGGAFLYGAQTPSNTLPATPVVAAEPAADPATAGLPEGKVRAGAEFGCCVETRNTSYARVHGVSGSDPELFTNCAEGIVVDKEACNPVPEPMVSNSKPATPTKCNPYVNGVYVGELCGNHDPFSDRAARTSREP